MRCKEEDGLSGFEFTGYPCLPGAGTFMMGAHLRTAYVLREQRFVSTSASASCVDIYGDYLLN
jgi:hypothetical protein